MNSSPWTHRWKRSAIVATVALGLLAIVTSRGLADFHADSSALYGTWRWERAWGGMLGADLRAPSGWSDLITFRPDGTYIYWQRDSLHQYCRAAGTLTIHPPGSAIASGPSTSLWIEMTGRTPYDTRQLVTYVSSDEIQCYPGGGDVGVDDALTTRFRRDSTADAQAKREKFESSLEPDSLRPPRIWLDRHTSWVEWPAYFATLRNPFGFLGPWADDRYSDSLRARYPYATNQTPAFVIGDFDADGLDDLAMQTPSDLASVVYFLLSGNGHARGVEVLREPLARRVDIHGASAPAPPSYLRAALPGMRVMEVQGRVEVLEHTGVLVTHDDGTRTVYWMEDGSVKRGVPAGG
ncbi:MAG: hypothetical protein ACM3JJ_09435 [Hyphomicrobiales bacterium]